MILKKKMSIGKHLYARTSKEKIKKDVNDRSCQCILGSCHFIVKLKEKWHKFQEICLSHTHTSRYRPGLSLLNFGKRVEAGAST